MAVSAENKPHWLRWIDSVEFNDPDFVRIVIFFVFHSPCKGLSSMGKTLTEYGWSDPWKKPYYLNKQLKKISSNPCLLYSSSSYDKMEEALRKSNLLDDFPYDCHSERVCIYNCQSNQFLSLFYHIRNAIAHGRFDIINIDDECVYIFEDAAGKDEKRKVSARMILKKGTLIKWIETIEHGEIKYVE